MARIMALDYGGRRTGIAVTDPLQIIANGLTTVDTRELMPFLSDYFKKEEVELVVVGAPTGLRGEATDATKLVQGFIKRFEKKFKNMPLDVIDETFTSKMAVQSMIEAGVPKAKRRNKKLIDQVSATLILQAWLKQKENSL